MNRWAKPLIAASFLAAAVLAGFISDAIEPAVAYENGIAAAGADRFTGMSLYGQLRISMGKYLWLRTEDYLHFGVTSNSHTRVKFQNDAMNGGFWGMWSKDGGRGAVGRKSRDWRGIFKRFDFIQSIPGYHGDPSELLPWYRAQTTINPLDTGAYVNGAFFLADFNQRPEDALDFLLEGAENNPTSPEIHGAIGRLYIDKWKKYDEAIPHLEKAVESARERGDCDGDQMRAVGNAYVYLVQSYRKKLDFESALRVAEQGMAVCSDYALVRTAHRLVQKDIAVRGL